MPKMMEISKILLYCCKAMPYLINTKLPIQKWELHDKKYEVCKEHYVNGKVCFECDCKEAIKLMYWWYNIEESNAGFYGDNKDGEMFCNRNFKRLGLGKDDISTNDKLFEYGKDEDLYAYHFENVKPIEPMPITHLFKDEACTKPLTKAPQSYCFAYRKRLVEESEVNDFIEEGGKAFDSLGRVVRWSTIDGYWVSEKVLVFSIRSPWLCKIANGEKDLEVRKTRIANAGIEYK